MTPIEGAALELRMARQPFPAIGIVECVPSPVVKCRIVMYDDQRTVSLGDVMPFPRKDSHQRPPDDFVAAEDALQLAEVAQTQVDEAVGVEWYAMHGTAVDRAALTLCRLRRARAGEAGGPQFGDNAVRAALEDADPAAVVWLLSRAISFMDEAGFPEAVEPWFE
jgi:hypothetical protein